MEDLKVFSNSEFGSVRVVTIEGEPWFVAADVCRALEIRNNRDAMERLDDDEKMTVGSTDSHSGQRGGAQSLNVVNEPGLYSLVLGSRKPEARKFKRWITHDVIPSIRKRGAYMTDDFIEQSLLTPDFLIKALEELKAERAAKEKAEEQVAEMAPKALFADAVTASDSTILVRELAKLLKQNGADMGERRLYKWLRENGYIIKGSTQPTQRAMELGLFETVERTVQRGGKPPMVTMTTKVTGKGQQYFINRILAKEG